MAGLRCASCGALNQDVDASAQCWKCGGSLGGAEAAAAPQPSSPKQAATGDAPIAPQLERHLDGRAAPSRLPLIATALILLLIALIAYVLAHR